MARSPTTAAPGNSIALKLTPEVHQTLVNVVATTGRITAAAGSGARVRHGQRLAAARPRRRGRTVPRPGRCDRAREGRLRRDRRARLNQLAIGGVMMLPAFDRDNNPIRDAHGQLIVTEKIVMPNPQALMFILDRVDPQPREPEQPGLPEEPERSEEMQMSETLARYRLVKEAVGILVELGVPREQIPEALEVDEFEARLLQPAIETTISRVPAEGEPAKQESPRPTSWSPRPRPSLHYQSRPRSTTRSLPDPSASPTRPHQDTTDSSPQARAWRRGVAVIVAVDIIFRVPCYGRKGCACNCLTRRCENQKWALWLAATAAR